MKKELERIYNYLYEYEKLCQKYHLHLWACGCCESPCLSNEFEDECNFKVENIGYDEKEFTFTFINKTKYIEEEYGCETIENMNLEQLKEFIDNIKE